MYMDFLLDYMDEYQVKRLEELFSEIVIQVLIEEKASVILILERLKQYSIEDLFLCMVVNINLFLCGASKALLIMEIKREQLGKDAFEAYMYGYEVMHHAS